MADPDNDPNAGQDLEADAQQSTPSPAPLPYQPPGDPFAGHKTTLNPHNLSAPRQTPAQDFGQRVADGHTAPPVGEAQEGPEPQGSD